MRGSRLVVAPFVFVMLLHCASNDAQDQDGEGPAASHTAASCAARWNPAWQQGPDASNTWVEVGISGGTVVSAYLEVVGVAVVPLQQRGGTWVGAPRSRIETGAWVVVHATNATGERAQTQVFGYLSESQPLGACASACVPSCRARACGGDGCGGSCGTCAAGQTCVDGACYGGGDVGGTCWSPAWHQTTDANNWWAEYATADAGVTSASLEVVGGRTVPLALTWDAWIGPTGARIETGAEVVLHAAKGTTTARTRPFKYLVDKRPSIVCPGDDGAPGVRMVGRGDTSDPARPKFGWPGARIIARFTGTAVSVKLDEESLYVGPSRWDVIVDGVRTSTLTPAPGVGTYTLATGLPDTMHTVELYRRTEGMIGTTQFLGYTFPNGGQLLSPPAPPTRRIEFLGDSTTNGHGNECTSPDQPFSGATQNERMAFSGIVARELGADHHDISVSGKGVYVNYHRADTVVFDQLFMRAMPNDPAPPWDFARFSPDVVWMNLGGNDWDQESLETPAPDLTAYTNKYAALVELVRSKYPTAHFFCSVTSSLNDVYPVGWNVLTSQRAAVTNVVNARVAAGDTKIYRYEFARATRDRDLTGCAYHTNLALHRRMADEVLAQIKAKTGW
ncbi:MAG: hypothetical protein KF819_10110 [Labilithrix sp.]|nr:hypothetical protein [Labilithrix sp.]